ncbi:MAG TPA: hypothetical protein VNM47_12380 [Terriglobia bacterium]|nr:hypothetical protein [Terriglobia bacterium]
MRKPILIAVVIICGLFPVAAFADQNSQGDSSAVCTVANVAGTYGYVGFGTVLPGSLLGYPPGSYSSVGTLTFDGKGNLLIADTERIDNVFIPTDTDSAVTYVATYTVNSQCILTFTIPGIVLLGIPGPHFKGVFVDNRKRIVAMCLIPDVVVNYVSTTKISTGN